MSPSFRCPRLVGATNASAVIPTVASECGRAGDDWGRRGPGRKGRGRKGLPPYCSRGPGSSRRRRSPNFTQCARRRHPRCVGHLKSVERALSGTHMASAGKKAVDPLTRFCIFPRYPGPLWIMPPAHFPGRRLIYLLSYRTKGERRRVWRERGRRPRRLGRRPFWGELTAAFEGPLNTEQIGAVRGLFLEAENKAPGKQVRRLGGMLLLARTAPRQAVDALRRESPPRQCGDTRGHQC